MNDKLDNAVPVRKDTSLLLTATTATRQPLIASLAAFAATQPAGAQPCTATL